jgi:hypothetical protein
MISLGGACLLLKNLWERLTLLTEVSMMIMKDEGVEP